ncbi:probable cytochrome P450 12a5, mitochondrial [Bactrocera neohumeralis]|uniref:probable cytochrome P450 12a5, mitochondrial n=1 Tax=Bactrocera neohumeralis TaxID=98809 RepID=UPI00216677B3|nr:probable cytochrome P450 12a5, mitochondrial [Bactrocera neohumeralis]
MFLANIRRKGGFVIKKASVIRLFVTEQKSLHQQHVNTIALANSQTATPEQPDPNLDWQRARPFSELPRVGALRLIRKFLPGGAYAKLDFQDLVTTMRTDYGPIFMLPAMMGRPNIVVTHNPDDFRNIFRNEGVWPIRPFSETIRYHRNKWRADFFAGVEGAIATQGEQWNAFRKAVNPLLMQPKNIEMYGNKLAQVNQEFVERIRAIRNAETLEMPADFEECIQRWTLESVAVVALDKQLGLLREDSEYYADALKLIVALNDFMALSVDLDYKPTLWRFIATPKFKRLMKAMDNIQSVTWKYINETVRKLEKESQQGIERSEHEQSILERLLKTDKKIATVMAMDMLMAGVDTTSSLAVGALLCLAKNPEKQEILRAEVMRVLPQKDGAFIEDPLKHAPYLRACLKESLRVYPVAMGNMRVPQNDLVLSGYQVPKNTYVSMIFAPIQSDARYYSRPLEFLPERWLRANTEVDEPQQVTEECTQSIKASSPFVYLPFGFGPRVCLGRRISELEVGLGVARLVRNFKIEFNYPTDKAFKGMLINMPNIPLKFKFTDIE